MSANTEKVIAQYSDWHLDIQEQRAGDLVGNCPFCGKAKHLYISPSTGQFDCKVCGTHGNHVSFMTQLVNKLTVETSIKNFSKLSNDRKIPIKILRDHKLAYYPIGRSWLVPTFGKRNTVQSVQRYVYNHAMRVVKGCNLHLSGVDKIRKTTKRIWVCEGKWDEMALQWTLDLCGSTDIAVSTPGAGTLKADWLSILAGYDLICAYDADDAGERGRIRFIERATPLARSVSMVRWPETAPRGFDVRDFITTALWDAQTKQRATRCIKSLEKMVVENGAAKSTKKKSTYKHVTLEHVYEAFERHARMTNDLRRALRCSLAVCMSREISGDPLWLYLVGPPSSGKTMILGALRKSEACVFRSTVTPHSLVSGWREGRDPSLIPQLSEKTFIAKDFTEVLALPISAREEVFSTLRGAYDGTVDRSFGNGIHRRYDKDSDPPFMGFSMLAGVTNAIHGDSRATLGERFLKLQIHQSSDAHQNTVNMFVLEQIGKELKRDDELQDITAAYLAQPIREIPTFEPGITERISALARLIALLRTQVERDKYTGEIYYRPLVEGGSRLSKQLGKLGVALAAMRGDTQVGIAVYNDLKRVALDTAYGFNADLVDAIMRAGGRATAKDAADLGDVPLGTARRRIEDLSLIGALVDGDAMRTKGRPTKVYVVSQKVATLWQKANAPKGAFDAADKRRRSTRISHENKRRKAKTSG